VCTRVSPQSHSAAVEKDAEETNEQTIGARVTALIVRSSVCSRSRSTSTTPRHSRLAPSASLSHAICWPCAGCACERLRDLSASGERSLPSSPQSALSRAACGCCSLALVLATLRCGRRSYTGRTERQHSAFISATRTPSHPAALPRDACGSHAPLNKDVWC